MEDIKAKVQEMLGKEVVKFTLKGKGACNNAYYVETSDGGRYIVKEVRADKESDEQNSLAVEADILQKLYSKGLSVPIPRVVFVSEAPNMYGYEYLDGEMMRGVWPSLSEEEKISLCREIGYFHAEIGKKISKEEAKESGVKIDESTDVHPEVSEDYRTLSEALDVPDEFKALVKGAKAVFDATADKAVFQFIHNDPHHENVLTKDKKISGIIDFGAAEWGEVAKEFSRYIRDYPDYFPHIVSAYEDGSGNKLSRERLVNDALVCGFAEIVEDYRKGGEATKKAEEAIKTYKRLLTDVEN